MLRFCPQSASPHGLTSWKQDADTVRSVSFSSFCSERCFFFFSNLALNKRHMRLESKHFTSMFNTPQGFTCVGRSSKAQEMNAVWVKYVDTDLLCLLKMLNFVPNVLTGRSSNGLVHKHSQLCLDRHS